MCACKIAFVLTGSIAAYKACEVISELAKQGAQVRTVATRSALKFVGEATLEGLTGNRVLTELFEPGEALEHINLSRWADLVVVCPATANTLNSMAAGLADDLPGALFLAHDRSKPFLVAPAMNPAMWSHPATQASVKQLSSWGVRLIPVGRGTTACGEVGEGRLAEPETVLSEIHAALRRPSRKLRVLVTAGGTSEPIDAVRIITNRSTGRTGAAIALHLARSGHEVQLLRSESSEPVAGVPSRTFGSFDDLKQALEDLLPRGDYDAIIHAAAVSDFAVAHVEAGPNGSAIRGKLSSSSAPVLRLRTNPKLVDALRSLAGPKPARIVAFKLTHGDDEPARLAAIRTLFDHSKADIVVHNDLSERTDAERFPSTLHFGDGRPAHACTTRTELCHELLRMLENDISDR